MYVKLRRRVQINTFDREFQSIIYKWHEMKYGATRFCANTEISVLLSN